MVAETVPREKYLEHLRSWTDRTSVVKVITGMRRCGKSTLLAQFREYLESEKDGNIVSVNFESKEMDSVNDYRDLNDYFSKHLRGDVRNYVLLDEIQRVSEWERSVNSLMVDYDADVYITGSNAYLLSSDLATYLSGRYVEIKVMPFSFREYLVAHPSDAMNPVDSRFQQYATKGAIPIVDPDMGDLADELLTGIYSTVIRKDIAFRLSALDLRTLDAITTYLISNVGNVTTSASIANDLGVSPVTVKRYLQALEDTFLVYKAPRFDVRGRRLLKSTEKYYCSDTGLRNAVLGAGRDSDLGRVIENIVFLELVRRGCSVRVGSYYDKEIDFIAEKDGTATYVQVSASVLDASTLDRELAPLRSVPDSYPKVLLTLDRILPPSADGIKIMNLVDWLIGPES